MRRLLRTDPDDRRRWEAAEALGQIRDPVAVPALLAAVTDLEPAVRLCVAEALGRVGAADARVAPALCCLLTDSDAGVRMATLEALGHLGDAAALPAVRTRIAAEQRTPEVRIWVRYALHLLGDTPFPFEEAFRLLRRGSVRTRVSAARALAQLGAREPAPRAIHRALCRAHARETGDGVRAWLAGLLPNAPNAVFGGSASPAAAPTAASEEQPALAFVYASGNRAMAQEKRPNAV